MGLKAAVQALKKAEPLKDKVQRCKDLLNDNDAWVCQQQLQKIYRRVLILDLEYALDRKVEQELWNLGFKNYIATLQSQAKDRKNPKRGESQAMLGWCLEAASGFYLTLLQEICTAFDLDLPFRRKSYIYGCTTPWKAVEKLSAPHKSSCFYACQYCLVHLGDIARYRNQNKQAELFYRHAVSLSPSSGQPYNQLALLEASRGDKLGTVFHYARSVAVKHPFPVASANLAKTLSSALNDNSLNMEGKTKLNGQEYISVFLKLHGILHNLGDLSVAATHVKLLTETLTALVATESFSSWRLVQLLVINLYALHHTAGQSADCNELLTKEQLCADEIYARDCILDLIAGSLSALLLPVYTIKNSIIDYFALPTIKLCLDWMRLQPTVLEEPAFVSRLQIWPSLCVLLNGLQGCVVDFDHEQYVKVPLPEDRDLQGFLPLEKSFESLRFANTDLEGNIAGLNKLRAVRILSVGHHLAQYKIAGTNFISVVIDEKKEKKFTCISEVPGPSNELMKELEELSLNKERQPALATSPVPSESASSKASSETDLPEHSLEKRVGILKPQGSLERNRDTNTGMNDSISMELNSSSCARKPRQNVAMQAIMRRAETEQKQVTFKNVSPMIIEELEMGNHQNPHHQPPISPPPLSKTACVKNAENHSPQAPIGAQNGLSPPSGNGQKRSTAVANVPISVQNSQSACPTSVNQSGSMNVQLSIGQTPQLLTNEQQAPAKLRSQFGHQTQNLGPSSPYQSFNVQNPQFGKNFVTNLPAQYQIPGQYNGTGVSMATLQQNVHQQRSPDYQRLPQTGSIMPPSGMPGPMQTPFGSSLPQAIGMPQQQTQQLQNVTAGLQQNMGMQQQQSQQGNGMSAIHRANLMSNNMRGNQMNVQNQMSIGPVSGLVNNGISAVMPGYQKNLQSPAMQNVGCNPPISPTGISGLQLTFNPNYGQNLYNQMGQKQISPSSYAKTQNQFVFPNPSMVNKPQTHPQINAYPIFHNYEPTDFNLWKDIQQPPQPPAAWWGSSSNAPGNKETPDTFQNWANSPPAAPGSSMLGRAPLTPGNNYHQNSLHGKHYNPRNSFDEARQYEMEQKQALSANTGNTYSLFSGNTWGSGGPASNQSNHDQPKARLSQQSLWSGPGPSPLERLLEQQKSLREGGT